MPDRMSITQPTIRAEPLDQHASKGGVSADRGGQAVGGNVHIEARDNSAAAWTVGEVNLGNPTQPGPSQG